MVFDLRGQPGGELMANTGQKLPLGRSLHDLARQKALDYIHLTGQPLPCSIVSIKGSIATVKFEVASGYNLSNAQMAIAEPLYSRGAHQVGDKGYALPAAAGTGNMTGLGPTAAPGLAKPGNLAALSFHPLGNSAWPDTGGKRLNQGPNGGVSQTLDGKNQAGGIPGGVLLTAAGISAVLTPAAIMKLAQLLGGLSVSGGGAYSSGSGDGTAGITGASSLNQLLLAYQYVQPLTGATVAILANVVVTTIDPAGAIAALTVDFPASPTDAQVQFLSFTQAVTTLSWGGGTIAANAPTSVPSGGGAWIFQYQAAAGKWFLI